MTPPIGAHVSPYFASGAPLSAYSADFASNDGLYRNHGDLTALDLFGASFAITFETWIKWDSMDSNARYMCCIGETIASGGNHIQYSFWARNTGTPQITIHLTEDGGGSVSHIVKYAPTGGDAFTTGVWYHIGMGYDVTISPRADRPMFWVGGVNKGSGTLVEDTGLDAVNESGERFNIGTIQDEADKSTRGHFYLPRVWSVRQSDPSMAANYNKQIVTGANLAAAWTFAAQTGVDDGPNGENLTATGSWSYSTDVPTL